MGNNIGYNTYNSDGSLHCKNIFKLDNKGNKIEDNKSYSNQNLKLKHEKHKYDYDKYGNWITNIKYRNSSPKEITEREIEYYD